MVVLMVVIVVVVVVVVGSRDGSIYRCTFFLVLLSAGGFAAIAGKYQRRRKYASRCVKDAIG